MFVPHPFNTTVAFSRAPQIIISKQAYEKMWQYVDQCDVEIGWLGTVERIGFQFIIQDIFLPEQDVTAATTEITEDGLRGLANELLTRPDGVELWNKMLFWGHSHVTMGTTASSVDENQMDTFRKNDVPYFIRGIFNKHGRGQFDLFLYEQEIVIHDVPWSLEVSMNEVDQASVSEEMESKLNRTSFGSVLGSWRGYQHYSMAENQDQAFEPDYSSYDSQLERWKIGDRIEVAINGEDYTGTITGLGRDQISDEAIAIIQFDDGDVGECYFDELMAGPPLKPQKSQKPKRRKARRKSVHGK